MPSSQLYKTAKFEGEHLLKKQDECSFLSYLLDYWYSNQNWKLWGCRHYGELPYSKMQ